MPKRRSRRRVRLNGAPLVPGYGRLTALAAAVPKDQAIVQIGVSPHIASALRAGSRKGDRARVYAVDPRRLGARGYGGLASGSPPPFWLDRLPPVIRATFHAAARWRPPIGLLVIEGDGSYEEIKAHYQEWGRHVPPNGALAFDLGGANPSPAAVRVILELVRRGMWLAKSTHGRIYAAIRW